MEREKELMVKEDMIEKAVIEYLKIVGQRIPESYAKQFIQICKAFQLNPFKREIYLIPYGNNVNIIVGYETYLKRAERSGKLSGWCVWTEGSVEDGTLKAIIEIKRKDWEMPFRHEVFYKEYKRETQIWKEKPYTMIKKVAIAQGFRLAFPEEVSGLPYTQEEMSENENVIVGEIVSEEVEVEKDEKKKFSGVGVDLNKVKERVKKEIQASKVETKTEKEQEQEKVEEEKKEEKREEETKWTIEKIKEIASEELKEIVRAYKIKKDELIMLYEKFDGDEKAIIEEISNVGSCTTHGQSF
ncbi:MAG: phage recombination protein Bet [Caldimicrobium sp.]